MNMRTPRSPGFKLAITVLIGALLAIPLLLIYGLVWDRQQQAETAQTSVAQGWGDDQILTGPMMVIPYRQLVTESVTQNGKQVDKTQMVERELFLAPLTDKAQVNIASEEKRRSIYNSVVYEAALAGTAQFAIPEDLARYGVQPDDLLLDRAEVRIGVSDARGLQSDSVLMMDGQPLALRPGNGLPMTNGSGFFAFADWSVSDGAVTTITYQYSARGNRQIRLVPEAENTIWQIDSNWPHPGFTGAFLPDSRSISDTGFKAQYSISNLALGRSIVIFPDNSGDRASHQMVQIDMIQPVNLYSQIDRAVKYGFLFIGFTFVTFLMFDLIGGARVAAAEYVLTGVGLILFFVMLLAFAEVIGFTGAYLVAAAAIVGLISSYSAAILGSWRRAGVIGAMLTGLYALLYVLLNLEAYSLIIGSLLLFVALAAMMYLTRRIDWSGMGAKEQAAAQMVSQ